MFYVNYALNNRSALHDERERMESKVMESIEFRLRAEAAHLAILNRRPTPDANRELCTKIAKYS